MKTRTTFTLVLFSLSLLAQRPSSTEISENGDPLQIDAPIYPWASSAGAELQVIPSGDDVEGDYHAGPQFNPVTNYAWVPHRTTGNISVVDVENEVIHSVIETGGSPVDIAFSDELGVVACRVTKELRFYDNNNRSYVGKVDLNGEPVNVELSRDGTKALVALDDTQQGIVINTSDRSVETVLDNFTNGFTGFSFITSNTRTSFSPSGMAISGDGKLVANGSEQGLVIFDLTTGTQTLVPEAANIRNCKFTDDGNTLVAVSYGADGSVYQIDVATAQVIASVSPAENINWASGALAMSNDGSRLLLPSTNSALYIRMDQLDAQLINTGSAVFWTGISADGTIGVAGGYNTHLVDMTDGKITATTAGISLNLGALSPDGTAMIAMDPLRRERAEIYLTTPNDIFTLNPVMLGSELEADATYSTVFTPDGKKVLAVNSLSGSVSVIDVESQTLEAIIPLSWYEIYHAGISPDGKYAVVGERLADLAGIIDLEKQEVVAEIPTFGDRPDQTTFHPNGEKAYVLNAGSTDNISVIDMTQSPPRTIKNIVSGNMGISWTNYGIRTNMAISDDGSRAVLATPFDDEIQLIDTENDEILESYSVGEFPLRTVLSDEIDGHVYAATTIRNGGKLWIAEDILNDPVPFGGLEVGGGPTQLDYDAMSQQFAVISSQEATISMVDPTEFEVTETQRFPSHLVPIAVRFTSKGQQITLFNSNDQVLPREVWIDQDMRIDLPSVACQYMDVSPDGRWVAIPGLARDEVYLIDTEATSTEDALKIVGQPSWLIHPNPVEDHFQLQLIGKKQHNLSAPQNVLIDGQGKTIRAWEGLASPNLSDLPTGTYFLKVSADSKMEQLKVVKR